MAENTPVKTDEEICVTSSSPSPPMISPHTMFIECINKQTQKETKMDIWKNSPFKDIVKLQSNNAGNVGETFIQQICDNCGIVAEIDGAKTKKIGGGAGDGTINNKMVEIKTSHQGCSNSSFQHELGEVPWKSDFIIFIDIGYDFIYLTIFNNFTEEFYKSGHKCDVYFPTKSVTWRKHSGAFKLDTTVKINEENIIKNNTIKITNEVNLDAIRDFILSKIKQ
jgi:hypothetical protein